jgi:hypothetical protein
MSGQIDRYDIESGRKAYEEALAVGKAWLTVMDFRSPDADKPVRCHRCGWQGTVDQTHRGYSAEKVGQGCEVSRNDLCPSCFSDELEPIGERDVDLIMDAIDHFSDGKVEVFRSDVQNWYFRKRKEWNHATKTNASETVAG